MMLWIKIGMGGWGAGEYGGGEEHIGTESFNRPQTMLGEEGTADEKKKCPR